MTKKLNRAHLTVDIEKDMHRMLKHLALKNETSLRAVVIDALEKVYVKGNKHSIEKQGQ